MTIQSDITNDLNTYFISKSLSASAFVIGSTA